MQDKVNGWPTDNRIGLDGARTFDVMGCTKYFSILCVK